MALQGRRGQGDKSARLTRIAFEVLERGGFAWFSLGSGVSMTFDRPPVNLAHGGLTQ